MYRYPKPLQNLINLLSKIPGVGKKTAQRIAFHVLGMEEEKVRQLSRAFLDARRKIKVCSICHNISESDPCEICKDPGREGSKLCIVEKPIDVAAIERSGAYKGKYHVLGGVISALDRVGPENLHISDLKDRIKREGIKEIIIALNPTHEGEITAHYLVSFLSPLDVTITRIGIGLPIGGSLEYTDLVTIGEALKARKKIK